MNWKSIYKSFILIIVYIVLMAITSAKHSICLPLMLILTFTISYFIYLKSDKKRYLMTGLLLATPISFLFLITCIVVNDFSRGLPYIVFVPIAVYLAFLFFKYKYWFIPILSIILFSFVSFFLFPNYFIYYQNHDAEKNILYTNVKLVNKKNEEITLDQNKIIVLDFWSTSCGICFKKFPDLQKTYDKFKVNKKVEIISVNVPIEKDKFQKTSKILDSIGYTFSKLYAKSFKEVEDNLKFNTFPHLIIIKEGRIRYDGYLVTNDESKLYNIDDEIEKLLNE